MLLACLAMQALMLATGLETRDELKVITLFHALGLALELFKVHVGSWSYPEEAVFMVRGVPLYSGFMYASVASYMVQAWRRFDLRFLDWPPTALVVPLGALIYRNFFTHHTLPDLRYALIGAVLVSFGRTRVAFTPVATQRQMPLVLAFLLIGLFVWFAENIATYLGAWQYPDQSDGWRMVSLAKLSSWSLRVIVSMMAVVQLKRVKGARPGQVQDVVEDRHWWGWWARATHRRFPSALEPRWSRREGRSTLAADPTSVMLDLAHPTPPESPSTSSKPYGPRRHRLRSNALGLDGRAREESVWPTSPNDS